MKLLDQGFQKLDPKQDRHMHRHTQTDRQTDATERITRPHSRLVIKAK